MRIALMACGQLAPRRAVSLLPPKPDEKQRQTSLGVDRLSLPGSSVSKMHSAAVDCSPCMLLLQA